LFANYDITMTETAGPAAAPIWLRPEKAGSGRPARRNRAEIAAAAIAIADREGLDAVSMRQVGAELGTGAASLYRYFAHREDLLDLMTDAVGAEYDLAAPTGDWRADLVRVAEQGRLIMLRHQWLPGLLLTRSPLGPHGLAVLEYVLAALAGHPASPAAKIEAFALMTGLTAMFVQAETAGDAAVRQQNATFLQHAATSGEYPELSRLLAGAPGPESAGRDASALTSPAGRFGEIVGRVLLGLLGPG
jgi:AcrR family transcriptional regulator